MIKFSDITTTSARLRHSDEQRSHYRQAFEAASVAEILAIETFGPFSVEVETASAEYRRAYRNLGIVEGWHS
jgi:hypothetical protein